MISATTADCQKAKSVTWIIDWMAGTQKWVQTQCVVLFDHVPFAMEYEPTNQTRPTPSCSEFGTLLICGLCQDDSPELEGAGAIGYTHSDRVDWICEWMRCKGIARLEGANLHCHHGHPGRHLQQHRHLHPHLSCVLLLNLSMHLLKNDRMA